MKFAFLRRIVLGAAVLNAAVCFGAQPSKVGIVAKGQNPNPADVVKAVQPGKGSGLVRVQTASDRATVKTVSPRRAESDAAFRK